MSARKSVMVCLVSLCGLIGGSALAADAALAEVSHPLLSSFDGHETPAGSFGNANGLAVEQTTAAVYVADTTNDVIDKFDAEHHYLCQITGSSVPSASECNGLAGSATAAGSFSFANPAALAVDNSTDPGDPSTGDLYVLDVGHDAVDKFSPSGAYLGEVAGSFSGLLGIGVDGSGDVWVYDSSANIYEFNPSGTAIFQFNTGYFAEFAGLSVDSNGQTYPTIRGADVVGRFSAGGRDLGEVDSGPTFASAVEQSTDDVYVDDGTRVNEYNPIGTPLGQLGSGQLNNTGNGAVAVNPVSGTIYVANPADGKVYVFAAAAGPRVMPGAATSILASSATVNATVNPEAAATTYKFEYGPSTTYGQTTPATDAGSGTVAVPVSAALSGLEGGDTYHYRLVASNANGVFVSADRTFTTLPVPVIEGTSITNLTAHAVDLHARIDPEGSGATYRFEYGTSTAYGTSIPIPDAGLGASSGEASVSEHIDGLSADTTYHWRVVASNTNGTRTTPDQTFVYDTSGGGLPDGRRYELVTPAHKNGALIGIHPSVQAQISDDGARVIAQSIQCFAGVQSCVSNAKSQGEPYEFTRTDGGWVTRPLGPPAGALESNTVYQFNANTDAALFIGVPAGGRYGFYARRPDGSFLEVGVLGVQGRNPNATFPQELNFYGTVSSGDLSHIVYETSPSAWPFDPTAGGTQVSLYEYVGLGEATPELVGVSGGFGSTDLISLCGTDLGAGGSGGFRKDYGSLSEDGRTVYFTAQGPTVNQPSCLGSGANAAREVPASQIYARIDGERPDARTLLISGHMPSDCTTPACQSAPAGDAAFEGASADGSHVFFTDTHQLTDDASEDGNPNDSASPGCRLAGSSGCNLYESICPSHCEDPAGRRLVDVSAGDPSGGPRVQGVIAISPDGSHVYFVAKGALGAVANSQGQRASDGAENLYVYERDAAAPEGRLAFVTTLASSDESEWINGVGVANVTPDGRFLVFTSHRALTPDATRMEASAQVYRYDAQAGALIRVSVGEKGFNDNGNQGSGDASIVPSAYAGGEAVPGPARSDPTMSNDGAYVFFQSPAALTSGALDDVEIGSEGLLAENIYEYHEGHVYLISDGRDTAEGAVALLGSDTTGANVFFSTADPLLAQDTNTESDYYDAHLCSAAQPCVPSGQASMPCEGEGCHGPPATLPAVSAPGSSSFSGPGNATVPSAKAPPRVKAKRPIKPPRRCRARKARGKRAVCKASPRKRHGGAPKAKRSSEKRRTK